MCGYVIESTTVKSSVIDTPNAPRSCKVCLLYRTCKSKVCEMKTSIKNNDRYYHTYIYAPCCSRQFIVVEGGFLT